MPVRPAVQPWGSGRGVGPATTFLPGPSTHHSPSKCFSLVAQSCPTLCDPTDCSTPGLPVHHCLPELLRLMSVQPVSHPTISSSVVPFSSHLQSFPASQSFPNESVLRIRWPKKLEFGEDWSFSFSTSPSNEHPGLISFRMDLLDVLAVQGTIKSLLQHNTSKASILQHSTFFIVQFSNPYMTTGKTIALTKQTFVG